MTKLRAGLSRNIMVRRRAILSRSLIRAIRFSDQHIESVGTTVRVQLAQRRPRNNDRGDYNSGRGTYKISSLMYPYNARV